MARYASEVGSPYRSEETSTRKLERDEGPARRVRRAAAATALIGASIGATTPLLGLGAAALGGGVALLGLLLLRDVRHVAMKAPCPSCGAEIGDIDPSLQAVLCPTCETYVGSREGGLFLLRDTFVADAPLFEIPLALAVASLPQICAECGEEGALRLVPLETRAIALLGEGDGGDLDGGPRPVVRVPHCSRHVAGAVISGIGPLRVRSHAFWLETRARALSSAGDRGAGG